VQNGWLCDVCEKNWRKAKGRYRCEICDCDYCEVCYAQSVREITPEDKNPFICIINWAEDLYYLPIEEERGIRDIKGFIDDFEAGRLQPSVMKSENETPPIQNITITLDDKSREKTGLF